MVRSRPPGTAVGVCVVESCHPPPHPASQVRQLEYDVETSERLRDGSEARMTFHLEPLTASARVVRGSSLPRCGSADFASPVPSTAVVVHCFEYWYVGDKVAHGHSS